VAVDGCRDRREAIGPIEAAAGEEAPALAIKPLCLISCNHAGPAGGDGAPVGGRDFKGTWSVPLLGRTDQPAILQFKDVHLRRGGRPPSPASTWNARATQTAIRRTDHSGRTKNATITKTKPIAPPTASIEVS